MDAVAVVAHHFRFRYHFRLNWCLVKGWQMLEGVWKLDLKWKAWKVYSFAAIQAMQQPVKNWQDFKDIFA